MNDIDQIRKANARTLADGLGSHALFADKIDRVPTQVSRIIGKNATKGIGNRMARHIEECFGKPHGWLDQPHQDEASEPDEKDSDAIDYARLERNIRHMMVKNGIKSDTELAERASMNQPTVSRILTSSHEPRLSNLIRIADTLGIEYWRLLEEDLTAEGQSNPRTIRGSARLAPGQIDVLRELIARVERILLTSGRQLDSKQRASVIAAAFATCLSQNISAKDLSDDLVLASVNTAIQSPSA